MKPSQGPPAPKKDEDQDEATAREKADRAEAITPPPTGATPGSPVSPVMKQFAKTKSESSGKS